MVTAKKYSRELIGKVIEVIASPNPGLVGIKGKVIDETRSTLRIALEGGKKKICILLKGSITFRIAEENLVISGRDLVRKPEERVKG